MSEISSRVAELSQRVDDLKVPPHSLEAEQSVIGGLMLDNRAWDYIADIVNEQDFYRHDHRLIFRSISALAEDDKPTTSSPCRNGSAPAASSNPPADWPT